ncbi:Kazrin [Acropora cervicornis]|uniref:Kazrin n=1 Tax=Acropora cervicornis TaxID=6130 RepID=A0AAD9UWY3_ACRCE|nr:Kazrin [Acropora cervicornis]
MSHKSNMADVNNSRGKETANASPAKEKKLYLTTVEAMAEVDKLKERVRSLSFCSSVSGESSDSGSSGTRPLARKQDDLVTCLSVMRRLMEQAESESKRMRDEKVVIATKINSSLIAVNKEVEYLRAELRDQDKRLSELAKTKHSDSSAETKSEGKRSFKNKLEIVEEENDRLRCEIEFLTRELNEWRHGNTDLDQLRQQLHSCELEASRSREAISCMKIERKRLKTEKMNLLQQMKQVYGILEIKEAELKEFIQNYEKRMLEGEERVKRLENDKGVWDRERADLVRESASLKSQLEMKDTHLKELETKLSEAKQHYSLTQSSLRENISQKEVIFQSNNLMNMESVAGLGQRQTNALSKSKSNSLQNLRDLSGSVLENGGSFQDIISDPLVDSASSNSQFDGSQAVIPAEQEVFELGVHNNLEVPEPGKKKKVRSSSLSRFFLKGKQRRFEYAPVIQVAEFPVVNNVDHIQASSSVAEKTRVWEMHKDIPMVCWKANMVLAWLEVECQMSTYSQMCYENIKSGKVLLELTDAELEAGLGIANTMHRRKLRLAIEDYREPTARKYPDISSMDHLWVSHVWIKDLGLKQYSSVFESQMIDGRLLNVLTKKDMEKYLNVNKKFHQTSVLHGVKLLRMMDYNRELLMARRRQSEDNDQDPLVWTNDRVAKWCCSVDLSEYADSLRDSGIHGAVLVLDPAFGAEELAQALGIHSSKNIIRRHLNSELLSVLVPARAAVHSTDTELKSKQKQKRKRSLSFNSGSRTSMSSEIKRHSFRVSLGGDCQIIGHNNNIF